MQNIAFSVTLNGRTTVLHMGDADVRDSHYQQPGHWDSGRTDIAFPPYWFFMSDAGRRIMRDRLRPEHAIGVHVPKQISAEPAARPDGLRDVDLFTRPGETRSFEGRTGTQ